MSRSRFNNKNSNEKQAYQRSISTPDKEIEKIVEDPVNPDNTDESAQNQEQYQSSKPIATPSRHKSTSLVIKDFFDHILPSGTASKIVVGVVIVLISTLIIKGIGSYRDKIIQEVEIKNIKKGIISMDNSINKNSISIKEHKEENDRNYNSLREMVNIFRVKILKDLEYMKKNH